MGSDRFHRAELAKGLLDNPIFADVLTEIRMDALLALAEVDAGSFKEIHRLQSIVHCTGEIVAKLKAMVIATGSQDGGVSMTATRKANTA